MTGIMATPHRRKRPQRVVEPPSRPTDMDVFLANRIIAPSGCWIWVGYVGANGYGQMRGGRIYVHRFAYEAFVGPIPEGLWIDHLCRVRRCCNPLHLQAVSPRINFLRGAHRHARIADTDVCKHGHSMEDAYVYPNGHRRCRTCRKQHKQAWDERRKSA